MREFEEYLITKDYDLGVALYQKYGTEQFLKSFFAPGRTDFRANKLLTEITKIVDNLNNQHKPTKTANRETLPSESIHAPEEIKQAIAKRKELYKQASREHARLEDIATDEERLKAAMIIVANFKKIAPLWDLTNFYDQNIRLPQKPVLSNANDYVEKSNVELNQIWITNYKYLRREVNNQTKIEQCNNRKAENEVVKQILEERGAFQYPNLNI